MVSVRLFAGLREKVDSDKIDVPLESGTSIEGFVKKLSESLPEIGEALRNNRATIAVNHELVEMDYILKEGDEVAIFPPVSGG